MQTDENDMKVEKSVSMHSHAFERPCKRQIVTDPKSRNASQLVVFVWLLTVMTESDETFNHLNIHKTKEVTLSQKQVILISENVIYPRHHLMTSTAEGNPAHIEIKMLTWKKITGYKSLK